MNFRSYSKKEIKKAFSEGKKVFVLDTGSAGEDDILIAEPGEGREDILADVLAHYEVAELPEGWTLEEIDYDPEDALDQNLPAAPWLRGLWRGFIKTC